MTRFIAIAFALAACTSPVDGDWELLHDDLDDCTIDLDIVGDAPIGAKTGDVEGTVDMDCQVPVQIEGDWYLYPLVADGEDVEGTWDRDEVFLSFEFYDEISDNTWEMEITGEIDDDEMEGDLELGGDDFGTFTGER